MDVSGYILAAVAVVGVVAAIVRWFYGRGGEERELAIAVRENTTVTRELSDGLASLKELTTSQYHELARRQDAISHRVDVLERREC